jgi:DNA-binding response OmpR family regulator
MPKHLLLVDDDELLRRSLAFNLEKAGYRVSMSANAEDALALAHRDAPDLWILDIGLPGMDGLEALRQYRQRANVPVIFLTARRRQFDQVLGLELGADDYVTKPFAFDLLLARLGGDDTGGHWIIAGRRVHDTLDIETSAAVGEMSQGR